jgi:hypothetical protein
MNEELGAMLLGIYYLSSFFFENFFGEFVWLRWTTILKKWWANGCQNWRPG